MGRCRFRHKPTLSATLAAILTVCVFGPSRVSAQYVISEIIDATGDGAGNGLGLPRGIVDCNGNGIPDEDDLLAMQEAKLAAADAATFDQFGGSVVVSGDTAIVGAVGDDDAGGNSGSAYVFVRSGGTWTQQAKLVAAGCPLPGQPARQGVNAFLHHAPGRLRRPGDRPPKPSSVSPSVPQERIQCWLTAKGE